MAHEDDNDNSSKSGRRWRAPGSYIVDLECADIMTRNEERKRKKKLALRY
jgi:hypothetical protein